MPTTTIPGIADHQRLGTDFVGNYPIDRRVFWLFVIRLFCVTALIICPWIFVYYFLIFAL